MSYNFSEFISKLKPLEASLIFITEKGDFVLNTTGDGGFIFEFDYPVRRKFLKNYDDVNEFINKETVFKVFLLDHETDEETMVWVDE